jgi:hypothetical protein
VCAFASSGSHDNRDSLKIEEAKSSHRSGRHPGTSECLIRIIEGCGKKRGEVQCAIHHDHVPQAMD